MDKKLDKIIKKINQIEKLHDKESLLCEEVKDLVEEVREDQSESEDDFDDDNIEDEDIDDTEEKE
jgi:hypothetical protein